jgi:hypothetical protein
MLVLMRQTPRGANAMTVREMLAVLNALPPEVIDFPVEICYGDGETWSTIDSIVFDELERPDIVMLLSNEI